MGLRRRILLCLAAAALLSASAPRSTYSGIVTDNMCGDTHADMNMGADAACVRECVRRHGARYSLQVGNDLFALSDQRASEAFAARKVVVKGNLDRASMTLQVESISPR